MCYVKCEQHQYIVSTSALNKEMTHNLTKHITKKSWNHQMLELHLCLFVRLYYCINSSSHFQLYFMMNDWLKCLVRNIKDWKTWNRRTNWLSYFSVGKPQFGHKRRYLLLQKEARLIKVSCIHNKVICYNKHKPERKNVSFLPSNTKLCTVFLVVL